MWKMAVDSGAAAVASRESRVAKNMSSYTIGGAEPSIARLLCCTTTPASLYKPSTWSEPQTTLPGERCGTPPVFLVLAMNEHRCPSLGQLGCPVHTGSRCSRLNFGAAASSLFVYLVAD
ncbi:hypothetical protein ABEF95_013059 [Exophiala dermatitidis]|uniref:Uncharacterized protein n=1 Tax=Exophiala dermatitidis (strain ATCC 34100 / CBS 525.76 / NIH/UT8656) TaxID=858893 RepID=H6BQX3_EXODN|nr:uncharacterized protein HMPREF1120_02066 [Exophiala dermatitidis NIH/UT8656]EHY53886.1 hypothetical protein HMPREF1120_02066 [Exophiala dermatitidis NIH/UT8656]